MTDYNYNDRIPKLLIVDDDESNLNSLSNLLELNGYVNHLEARSGKEVFKYIEEEQIDCILLDIHLPDYDGYSICEKIKTNDKTKDIPIIFLTAKFKDDESMLKGFEAGGDDYLTKPYNYIELIAKIKVMTKLKSNIDQLKKERDFSKNLIENANAIIFVVNGDYEIIELNKRTENVLNLNRSQVINKNLFDLLYENEDYKNDVFSTYKLVTESQKQYFELETIIKNKSDQDILVRWSITFSYGIDNKVYEIVNIGHDITETSRLQNTIELLAADLKLKNVELDQKNIELQAKNQQLTILNKMKDDILHIASHDLRSPLNGILGYTQLLLTQQRSFLTEKQISMIEKIQSCGEIQLNLINDLLDIAKLESGKMDLKLTKVNFVDVIKSSIETVEGLSLNKRISLTFRKNLEIVWLTIDVPKITQVINNLLNNAIKFTPAGGVIEVSLFAKDNLIEVSVKDSGIGIEKDNLSKVFKKFSQINRYGTQGEKGTGLGLSICKNLIESHNGIITVFSEGLNKGTTFLFTLPYK